MAKIGQLLLNNGTWEGNQILPEDWVSRCSRAYSSGGSPEYVEYGYHLWVSDETGFGSFFAGGFGGQYLY